MKRIFFFLIICSTVTIGYAQVTRNFVDSRDGQIYKVVKIGEQWWLAENLRTSFYTDGTPINQVTDNPEWCNLTSGAYCWYLNDSATYEYPYGRMYNWFAVNTNKLCPIGWHVPSDADWKQLEMSLGMTQYQVDIEDWRGTDEGGKLKESGYAHWDEPNSGATNESLFSALPGGSRSTFAGGNFLDITHYGQWWTSTENPLDLDRAFFRALGYDWERICRGSFGLKRDGFNVRCVGELPFLAVSDSFLRPFTKLGICGNEITKIIISNNSSNVINITSIYNNNPVFSINYSSAILSNRDSIHLNVTFNPIDEGVFLDTLFIVSDDELSPLIIIPINAIFPSEFLKISVIDSSNVSCGGLSDGTARVAASVGSPPYHYQWDDQENTKDSVVDNLSPNIYYHVIAEDRYGCFTLDSIMLSEPDPLEIIPDYSTALCLNDNNGYIDLNTEGGEPPYSFAWSNGQTTENLNDLVPGDYSVTVSDDNDCKVSGSFNISVITPYANEDICMVTVDPGSGMNMILWERTPDQSIFSYNIYRETSIKDNYELIGNSLFADPGSFLDNNSVPAKQSYRYKITAIDNCGNESGRSSYHSTMHLTLNIGLNNATNLIWSKYEGFDVQTYNIWRGPNTEELSLIGAVSGSNFTFSDLFPLEGTNIYQVEVVSPYTCNPDNLKALYSSSVSNFAHRNPEGIIKTQESSRLLVQPNPFSNTTVLSFNNPEGYSYTIYITDLSGKLCLFKENITTSEYILEKEDLEKGLYLIELRGPKVYRGKIIIE